ncbi:Dabb family protein [Nocardia sp. NPDC055053]
MLIHCLTITFKSSATADDVTAFGNALAALPDQVDVPMRTRQGPDLGERANNADYAVVSEFHSAADFYCYLQHPAHQALPVELVASMSSVQFLVEEES